MARYAIKTPPQHSPWSDILSTWRAADEIDVYESAWLWDHFYPLRPPYDGPCLEGWTALSALAGATSRLRLGSMVNGMPYRHPAVTANMAATLDIISGGRFLLGLGAGWNEMEAEAYGIELGTLTERFDRFDEGLEIIRSLLDNELTTFLGEHFTITDARCEPKPVQDRLPIVIGGKGPRRTLRAVARWADQWDMAFPESPGEWERLDRVLQQHCADVGRDHAEITRSVHFRYNADDDPAALVDHAAPFFGAGVDVVVWTMGSPISPQRVEALAASL